MIITNELVRSIDIKVLLVLSIERFKKGKRLKDLNEADWCIRIPCYIFTGLIKRLGVNVE